MTGLAAGPGCQPGTAQVSITALRRERVGDASGGQLTLAVRFTERPARLPDTAGIVV